MREISLFDGLSVSIDMEIRPDQLAILDSFSCVRLSDCEKALRLVDTFENPLNENLVDYIKGQAFDDDENGRVACFLVLDQEDNILCFFTLKCGILYHEFEELRLLEQNKKLRIRLKKLMESKNTPEIKEAIQAVTEEIKKEKKKLYRVLGSFESLPENKHVSSTYSGVELSHFCVNVAYKPKWQELNFGRNKLGATLFWYFIVPKVLDISKLVGCEYLYLFAADASADMHLVNHYKNLMGFRDNMNVLTIQPIYDFQCRFLCTLVKKLIEGRRAFFLDFNGKSDKPNVQLT